MFEKIRSFLKSLSDDFDPSVFNDPIALQTGWGPLKRGGANFKTHVLEQTTEGLVFKPSIGMVIFSGIFGVAGIVVLGVCLYNVSLKATSVPVEILAIFGVVFTAVGFALFYFGTRPKTFSTRHKVYWVGRRKEQSLPPSERVKDYTRFEDIHAIQIISERVRSKNSSYTSYEINLVKKDASRVNVVDHGNYSAASNQAQIIADLLEVPLWSR